MNIILHKIFGFNVIDIAISEGELEKRAVTKMFHFIHWHPLDVVMILEESIRGMS